MPKILFIKNPEELNYIERHFKTLLSTHKIITICSLPWFQLYSEGFAVECVSDYLLAEEFNNILKQARQFSQDWYKSFEDLLNYRGINLGELIRLDQFWFFRELISSYLAIQRIIEVHRPQEVALFANLDVPNLGAHQFNGTSDIFAAVVIWKCETSKIPIQKLYYRYKFKKAISRFWRRVKRKIIRYIPYTLFFYRSLKRAIENIIYLNNPNRIPLNSFSRNPHKKLAVALGNGFELLILKPVMETLSELGDFNVAFLNIGPIFDTVHLKNRSGLDVDKSFKFVSLEDFISSVIPEDKKIISSLKDARIIFEKDNEYKETLIPSDIFKLLKSRYLAVQFDFVWSDYLFEGVYMADKLCRVYRLFNPDVVIVANAIGYTQRIFVKLAREFKAKSITVPHGWIGDIDNYDFESDLFLAWGELSKTQLIEEFNKSTNEIAVVGAIQFEKIVSSLKEPSYDRVKNIKQWLGLRQDAKVVTIITSGLPQSVFSALDGKRYFEVWELMKVFIKEHPEIDFIIRPHPYSEAIDWLRHLARDFHQPNLRIVEGEKLESFLPAVDAGILIAEGTAAGYLSILFGVPIIIFKSFLRTGLFNTIEDWSQDNGLLIAKQERELFNLVLQMLNDDNFRKETIEKEQKFLDRSLLIRDGKTRERIMKAVEVLCK